MSNTYQLKDLLHLFEEGDRLPKVIADTYHGVHFPLGGRFIMCTGNEATDILKSTSNKIRGRGQFIIRPSTLKPDKVTKLSYLDASGKARHIPLEYDSTTKKVTLYEFSTRGIKYDIEAFFKVCLIRTGAALQPSVTLGYDDSKRFWV